MSWNMAMDFNAVHELQRFARSSLKNTMTLRQCAKVCCRTNHLFKMTTVCFVSGQRNQHPQQSERYIREKEEKTKRKQREKESYIIIYIERETK